MVYILTSLRSPLSLIHDVKLDSGTSYFEPVIEHKAIRAFTLEPLGTPLTWMAADGEPMPVLPARGEIHPGLARMIVP